LKELKDKEEITILKAGKGNATVIMNSEDYNEKVNCLLNDSNTYIKFRTKSIPMNAITFTEKYI